MDKTDIATEMAPTMAQADPAASSSERSAAALPTTDTPAAIPDRIVPRGLIYAAALAAAGIALLVLFGWATDINDLKSILPGQVAMQPWTAVGALLGALSLGLSQASSAVRRSASVAVAVALAVAAALALLQYVTGRDFGTDYLLFHDAVLSRQPRSYPYPGRMGAFTAMGFAALAGALLLLGPARHNRVAGVAFSALASIALLPAASALLVYLSPFEPISSSFLVYSVSFPTAIAIGIVAVGALALRPDVGWVRLATAGGLRGWIIAGVTGAAALAGAFGTDRVAAERIEAAKAARTPLVLNILLSTLKDAETGQRGYLLLGKDEYLKPYTEAQQRLPGDLASVASVLGARPATKRLDDLAQAKMAELAETIALRRSGHLDAALALVAAGHGQVLMDTIRSEVERVSNAAIAAGAASDRRGVQAAVLTAITGSTLLGLALFGLSASTRSRRALAESDERLRTATDTAHIGLVVVDPTHHYRYVNRAYCEILRIPRTDIVGLRVADVLAPLYPTIIRPRLERAFRGERVDYEMTQPPPTPGGTERHLAVTYEPGRDRSGEPIVVVLVLDITERTLATRALAENEARLRLVIENAPIPVMVHDQTGHVISLSQVWTGISGYSIADIPTISDWANLAYGDRADRARAAIRDFFNRPPGEPFVDGDHWIRTANGETRLWHFTGTILDHGLNHSRQMVSAALDVTDSRTAARALADSEARLRMVLAAGQISTFTYDVAADELLWDQQMRRLWGVPDGVKVGLETFYAGLHPGDLPRVKATVAAALDPAGSGTFNCEYRVIDYAGDGIRHVLANALVEFEAGRAVRMIGTTSNVTELREAQNVLQREAEELERLAEVRGQALAESEARLARVAKMEALGRLAGGIAHDFNNVLQTMQSGIELASRRLPADAEGIRRYLTLASKAAERGVAVTSRLLAFARRSDLNSGPIAPKSFLIGLEEMLRPTIGTNIEVTVSAPDGLPPLLADSSQLETVIVNLSNNSRDAMRNGGRLTLSAEAVTIPGATAAPDSLTPGAYVRLSVRDEGEGMTAQILARVSEPFFTTKPKGEGTGLGLAMARGFTEQSGGALTIESIAGGGTTVSIWLPRAPEDAAIDTELDVPGMAEVASTDSAIVLLVDDQPEVRAVIAAMLADGGHDVREAETVATAVALIDQGLRPSVLVTDFAMPESHDGLDLLQQARTRLPHLPGVLITGHVGEVELSRLISAERDGPFTLLRKPTSSGDLLEGVARVLQRSVKSEAP